MLADHLAERMRPEGALVTAARTEVHDGEQPISHLAPEVEAYVFVVICFGAEMTETAGTAKIATAIVIATIGMTDITEDAVDLGRGIASPGR